MVPWKREIGLNFCFYFLRLRLRLSINQIMNEAGSLFLPILKSLLDLSVMACMIS